MTDPHVLAPGFAPTSFTAEEIRLVSPEGCQVDIETVEDGAVVGRRRTTFSAVDAEGATASYVALDEHGEPEGEVRDVRTTWLELQRHASFPADAVEIVRERVETPLGLLDCTRYDLRDADGEFRFWFADAHPGMPVRFGPVVDGELASETRVVAIRRG